MEILCLYLLNMLNFKNLTLIATEIYHHHHHHGFALLTKIKLRQSKFPAGTLVTYQAYARSTSSVAVTAGKGLIGVWCYGCTVFPPLTFLIYGRLLGGFEGGGSLYIAKKQKILDQYHHLTRGMLVREF